MVIEIIKDHDKGPPVICGHCKKELHILLDAFKPDVTKIVRSNCTYCGAEIYAGLLILAHTNLHGLIAAIQQIVNMADPDKLKLIDNPKLGSTH